VPTVTSIGDHTPCKTCAVDEVCCLQPQTTTRSSHALTARFCPESSGPMDQVAALHRLAIPVDSGVGSNGMGLSHISMSRGRGFNLTAPGLQVELTPLCRKQLSAESSRQDQLCKSTPKSGQASIRVVLQAGRRGRICLHFVWDNATVWEAGDTVPIVRSPTW
jgi:hypothetical protein